MLNVDDARDISRSAPNLAKMMKAVVQECNEFVSNVLEKMTESMFLRPLGTPSKRLSIEAAAAKIE